MQIQRIQTTNRTTFGTKIGKNLSEFIRLNGDGFTTEELRNLARIRNNKSYDTVLELENVTREEQQKYNYIYKLNLHSNIVDRKT